MTPSKVDMLTRLAFVFFAYIYIYVIHLLGNNPMLNLQAFYAAIICVGNKSSQYSQTNKLKILKSNKQTTQAPLYTFYSGPVA